VLDAPTRRCDKAWILVSIVRTRSGHKARKNGLCTVLGGPYHTVVNQLQGISNIIFLLGVNQVGEPIIDLWGIIIISFLTSRYPNTYAYPPCYQAACDGTNEKRHEIWVDQK
jgi:hypothetical protein